MKSESEEVKKWEWGDSIPCGVQGAPQRTSAFTEWQSGAIRSVPWHVRSHNTNTQIQKHKFSIPHSQGSRVTPWCQGSSKGMSGQDSNKSPSKYFTIWRPFYPKVEYYCSSKTAAGAGGKPKGWQDWWCVMGWRMKVISAIHLRHWDILAHMPHEYISLDMVHGWTPPIHSWRENENESLSHSLVTGDQCQLLTEGHSRRILGVKVRCTYSEADYPLMQAGRLSRTYECTLKSKSGMSAETRMLGVPPVLVRFPNCHECQLGSRGKNFWGTWLVQDRFLQL